LLAHRGAERHDVAMDTATAPRSEPRRSSKMVPLGLVLLCAGGGGLIGAAFASQTRVYEQLTLPAWAPPGWLFGPVWTVLYVLMAVSAWLTWRTNHRFRTRALTAFGVQLALNFAWTSVFFGAGELGWGLAVLVAVLLAAGWWVTETARVHRVAAGLQMPYLAWLCFATALNAAILAAAS
jgi:translocator protein